MNKFLLILLFAVLATTAKAQFYSVKTNLLGLATTNLNVEAGISVHRNWSLHLPGYSPETSVSRT